MATMIIDGKKVTVTIIDKARMLKVFEIGEAGRLAVTSGSDDNRAYVVQHDGWRVRHCPCKAIGQCAHGIAAQWFIEAQARAKYEALFNPNGI